MCCLALVEALDSGIPRHFSPPLDELVGISLPDTFLEVLWNSKKSNAYA